VHYLGIDIGKKSSTYYVADDLGNRVSKGLIESSPDAVVKLVEHLLQFREGVEVAIEAGNATFKLARAMEEAGADVFVVHPRDNAVIALSRKKTDGIDAKMLSEQRRRSILPAQAVHVPTEALENLRHLVAAREALIKKRTAATNQLLHILARYCLFPAKRVYKTDKAWTKLVNSLDGVSLADQLIIRAHASLALVVNSQIRELDKGIDSLIQRDFARPQLLLRSVPGIGPVTTSSIIAWGYPIDRFASARHFASYAGLTPSVRQSGARLVTGGTSRSGNRHLGRNFVQAALTFINTADEEHELYKWYDGRDPSKLRLGQVTGGVGARG
jgi:transposase